MEIKDILLFLEAGEPCAARLALGVALARGHGAALTALCACPEPAMDPGIPALPTLLGVVEG